VHRHTAQWLILHNSLHQANVVAVVTGAAAVVMTRRSVWPRSSRATQSKVDSTE
jgi:hypothetical protein